MSYDQWSSVCSSITLQPACPLVGITSAPLKVAGTAVLPLTINGISTHHLVHVAHGVNPPCILGRDFLSLHNCVINLATNSLSVHGATVPLTAGPAATPSGALSTSTSCPRRVGLTTTTVIPPYHEMILPANVSPVLGCSIGVVEGDASFTDRCATDVARVLVSVTNDVVPVRLANFGPKPVTLYSGTHVGTFHPCDPSDVCAKPASTLPTGDQPVVAAVGSTDPSPTIDVDSVFNLDANDTMSNSERQQLRQLLDQHHPVFSPTSKSCGQTSFIKHTIPTGSAPPIRQPHRRISPHLADTVRSELDAMLADDVIEPSSSSWASPVVLVKKKDGGVRFCIDYRKVNAVTVKDAFPIPRIDDTLDCLAGAKYFSTLDLKSGYWQVQMEDQDKCKTAFTSPYGLFQFNVMPFGLTNAPATFQRLMSMVLRGLQWEICLVYLDDIIIFSTTFSEHLQRLDTVFSRLADAGLTVKPSKCHLLCKSVEYLGHVISPAGVATDPAKTATVASWPTPSSPAHVRSFLGLASYYRRFVPNFAAIAAPLSAASQKGSRFQWTPECQNAFDLLKTHLTTSPVLAFPDFQRPFLLDTDASDLAIGGVLSQVNDSGKEQVIAYASSTLTKAQRNYSTTRKELLAVVTFVERFRHYLAVKPFTLRTDHSSLRWLHNFHEPTGQLARWLERLADFNYEIQHRPGKSHGNADGLSRRPSPTVAPPPSNPDEHLPLSVAATNIPDDTPDDLTSSAWFPGWSTSDVFKAQRDEPLLAYLCECIDNHTAPSSSHPATTGISRVDRHLLSEFDRLELHNTLLFRRFVPTSIDDDSHIQLVVPAQFRSQVLEASHSHATGGHLGTTRMFARISHDFYWPGWRTAVERFCKYCHDCAQRKTTPTPRAPMGTVPSGYPWERIALDIMGPVPTTARGNRYILVIADYFSKWTESFPMPDMTATTIATLLFNHVICRFGVPRYIHSDQGRQFESQIFHHLCSMLGMKKTRTTPYRPQSDGMVERFNRTLQAMISCCVDKATDDWDIHLPALMLAYRTTVHASTGYTPYFLLFGHEATLPATAMFPLPVPSMTHPEYVRQLETKLNSAYSIVRQFSGKQHRRQKALYDRHTAEKLFSVNDLVWLHQPAVPVGIAPKFHRPWKGPYRITQKVSTAVVRITLCQNPRRTVIVHIDRLKPYLTDDPDAHIAPLPPPVDPPPPHPPYRPADDLCLLDAPPDAPLAAAAPPLAPAARPQRNIHPPAWHAGFHFY